MKQGVHNIKAVFFDIDGTLVSFTTHGVPDSARRAIKQLRERGVKVFIATGRLLRHTDVVSDIEVDGYITVNGSYCLTSTGEVIFELSFDGVEDVVEKLVPAKKAALKELNNKALALGRDYKN